MKYLPLLNVYLTHTYYADGRCPDFRIEPTPETQRLLANYRCILKPLPNGSRVLTAVDGGAPLIAPRSGMTFAFQLWLQNPDFALFTDLAAIAQAAAPVYTNSQASAGAPVPLELLSRQAVSTERFIVRQPGKAETFCLSGRPLAGLQAADFKLVELGRAAHPASYDAAANVIAVDSSAARQGDAFAITYATAPRREGGAFADVEIAYGAAPPSIAAAPAQYRVEFKAKQARWSYYVVTDNASAAFRIEDKDKQAPLVFGAGTDLGQQPDPSDAVAAALAEQYPALRRLRFVSEAAIPCRQAARKSLQLLVDGEAAVEPLPNPALRNYAIDAGPGDSPAEIRLFHVVKFFTQLISTSGG